MLLHLVLYLLGFCTYFLELASVSTSVYVLYKFGQIQSPFSFPGKCKVKSVCGEPNFPAYRNELNKGTNCIYRLTFSKFKRASTLTLPALDTLDASLSTQFQLTLLV